jgi:hypothetical protein
MTAKPALPASVAALPQEIRDAMGRALVEELVAAIEALGAEGRRRLVGEEGSYGLEVAHREPEQMKSGRRASTPPAVMAEVR